MTAPAPADARSRSKTLVSLALALIGLILLLITVRRVGWAEVQHGLRQVGWGFLLVMLLGGLRHAARARAWMAAADGVLRRGANAAGADEQAPAPRFATRPFFAAVLAGDALGNVTPFGLLASEPTKILLVRHRLPLAAGIPAIAIENAFYIASVVTMLAAGAIVFINLTELPAGLRVGVQAVLAGAAVLAAAGAIAARHQPAVLSRIARTLSALTGRGRSSHGQLQEIERQFYGMLTWPPAALARVAAWEALYHLAAVVEVYLVLWLLFGGAVSVAEAFVLETTGRLIALTFKFVPYRLGVDEAGTATVASVLGLGPTAGVTLALVRRLRILGWNAVGLAVLARSR